MTKKRNRRIIKMTIQVIIVIINRTLRGIKDIPSLFLMYNTNGITVYSRSWTSFKVDYGFVVFLRSSMKISDDVFKLEASFSFFTIRHLPSSS